jgi:SNF2 family DNA or RNA helicase
MGEFFKKNPNLSVLDDSLKIKLFPYQLEGVKFAAKAGRSLIADDMGLGKTVQAIVVAELYKKS